MTQTLEPQVAGAQAALPRVSHWINGKIVESTSGQSRPVYNPATGRQTKTVDVASPAEIEMAVAAAKGELIETNSVVDNGKVSGLKTWKVKAIFDPVGVLNPGKLCFGAPTAPPALAGSEV